METTKVFLRETNTYKIVNFRDKEDDHFHDEMIEKWQAIIDIGAKVLNVDAGLIMKITKEHMEVFLKSNTPNNPYPSNGKDSLGHGLYCETVIGTNDKLYVKDSLSDSQWKDNPDVKIGMISYLGYPIRYPNGDCFGTICTLDREKMELNEEQFEFLKILRDSIEKDLILLEKINEIHDLSYIDHLTGIFNRRYMKNKLEECQEIITRSSDTFLITTIDLNDFKIVNDTYGHSKGDDVLQIFAELLQNRFRKIDYFGRIGGDEFLIVSFNTPLLDFSKVMDSLHISFTTHKDIKEYGVSFAYGSCEATKEFSVSDAYIKADAIMYENKSKQKQQ